MPSPTLKPCPFCGCDATLTRTPVVDGWHIGCRTNRNDLGFPCPGSLSKQGFSETYPTKEIAIAAWNRRAEGETK